VGGPKELNLGLGIDSGSAYRGSNPRLPAKQFRIKHFLEEAVFVHMGGTMSKNQELDVIRSGGIQYKNVEIQEVSVRFIGTTAILLNKIRLVAVVGGNEVTNPFVVTEVYVQQSGTWKLGSLSFTRLLGQ
jgi:hypothetical protein